MVSEAKVAVVRLVDLLFDRIAESSRLGRADAVDDESSGQSPVGAARAESDDDDANDARRREELDGNLMKSISSCLWARLSKVGMGWRYELQVRPLEAFYT
jgi:hypothetical protein